MFIEIRHLSFLFIHTKNANNKRTERTIFLLIYEHWLISTQEKHKTQKDDCVETNDEQYVSVYDFEWREEYNTEIFKTIEVEMHKI